MDSNNAQILFSVIIPLYNKKETIELTLQSVFGQSVTNYEIIVVDDCSTDGSFELVMNLNDPRIYLTKNEINSGPICAKNKGIGLARGRFVSFLDADDVWHPNYLSKVLNEFYSYGADVVYTYYFSGPKWELFGSNVYSNVLKQGYLCMPSVLSVNLEFLLKTYPFDQSYFHSEDDHICFELAKNAKIGLVKEELVAMIGTANSMTNNKLKIALGFQKLYSQYKKDILFYCGKSVLGDHMLRLSLLFLESGKLIRFLKYYVYSISLFIHKFNFGILFKLTILPIKSSLKFLRNSSLYNN